ncbi:hypothetical protein HDU85_006714 [Gaertneriomyces sp. JEL0708]|nr:hypothetical protein HDU85_006714 [Gaertneriomyces sp. JEL0708]
MLRGSARIAARNAAREAALAPPPAPTPAPVPANPCRKALTAELNVSLPIEWNGEDTFTISGGLYPVTGRVSDLVAYKNEMSITWEDGFDRHLPEILNAQTKGNLATVALYSRASHWMHNNASQREKALFARVSQAVRIVTALVEQDLDDEEWRFYQEILKNKSHAARVTACITKMYNVTLLKHGVRPISKATLNLINEYVAWAEAYSNFLEVAKILREAPMPATAPRRTRSMAQEARRARDHLQQTRPLRSCLRTTASQKRVRFA